MISLAKSDYIDNGEKVPEGFFKVLSLMGCPFEDHIEIQDRLRKLGYLEIKTENKVKIRKKKITIVDVIEKAIEIFILFLFVLLGLYIRSCEYSR